MLCLHIVLQYCKLHNFSGLSVFPCAKEELCLVFSVVVWALVITVQGFLFSSEFCSIDVTHCSSLVDKGLTVQCFVSMCPRDASPYSLLCSAVVVWSGVLCVLRMYTACELGLWKPCKQMEYWLVYGEHRQKPNYSSSDVVRGSMREK